MSLCKMPICHVGDNCINCPLIGGGEALKHYIVSMKKESFFPFPIPQMMPCSWLLIFSGSVIFFVILNSCWSTFFFLSSFPKSKGSLQTSSKFFWS